MTGTTWAIAIFLLAYAGLVVLHRGRWVAVWIAVLAGLLLDEFGLTDVLGGIDWNVLGIFVGSVVMAELFSYSRLPEAIADQLGNRSPNLTVAFVLVIAFASLFSIVMDNVVTVLVVAPIALQMARKGGVSPVPVIVGVAISSNLQGMAILIGDYPSMIVASRLRMNFWDFFWFNRLGEAGIFWLVQVGAVVGLLVLLFFVRGHRQRPPRIPVAPVRSWFPLTLILLAVFLLSFAPLADPGFRWYGGVSCMLVGIGGLAWYRRRERERGTLRHLLKRLHWGTVLLLAGIFALVRMLGEAGVIDAAADRLAALGHLSPFALLMIVVWFSVAVSAFIDNVPYITAVLPVVIGVAGRVAPAGGLDAERFLTLLAFGVLIGSCMGGNITPIGAAANIAATSILRREGHPVSFGGFVRIGLPFTIAATAAASLVLYLVYG